MNEEILSALLDGECAPAELEQALGELQKHPEARRRLSRQVLAGDVARGLRVRAADLDFADRVMARLDTARVSADVASPAPRRPSLPWRQAGGFALAAALGAVAVLVLRPAAQPMAVAPVALAPEDLPAGTIVPAAAPTAAVGSLDEQNRRQLRNYLITYSQSRAQQGMGGTLGYARFAAYTDYQPQDSGH